MCYTELEEAIQKGKAQAAIVIPENFEADLKKGKQTSLQVILDGTDANTATISASYISQLIARYSENIFAEIKGQWRWGWSFPSRESGITRT